jgi:hypothetical protein
MLREVIMTRCLTDTELQTVADHEADAALRTHVAGCPRCRTRVEEVERHLARLGAELNHLPGPSIDFERRVQHAMHAERALHAEQAQPTGREQSTAQQQRMAREQDAELDRRTSRREATGAGATTLRLEGRGEWRTAFWRRRAWTSALAAAALVVLAVFVVWPSLTKDSRLSAAEVLGRSLQTFSSTSGVETFAYDVQFEGVPMQPLVPDERMESLRVEQVIDHDHPGRYRVMKIDANNSLRLVLAQDPERGVRAGRFRVDDRMYFFRFTAAPERARTFVSLPDLQRAYVRALVTMMQGMADQQLATVDDGSGAGPYYSIQMPQSVAAAPAPPTAAAATATTTGAQRDAALWDLSEAHALVHAGDFHLKELSARGTFLGQPFHIAFTLVRHDSTPSGQIDASQFSVEPEPGDIMLQGEATNDPAADVVLAALRALGQAAL